MNFFNSLLNLNGYKIDKAISEFQAVKELRPGQFQDWQLTRRWEQFEYFKRHNDFYRSLLTDRTITNWEELPVIRKDLLIKNHADTLSSGFSIKSLYKNNTSGSTGQPLIFYKDKFAHAMTWALILDRYGWHGIEYGKSLQARFYGIPLDGFGFYKERMKDRIASRVRFPVFNLSDKILDNFTQQIKRKPFVYLNGYTSALVTYAQYLLDRDMVLNQLCPTLRVCFPTSEMLNTSDRVLMEKAFGVKVYNEYGCAEIDILGFEDAHGDFVFSDENVFVEVLDDNDQPVPLGERGRMVITSLYNKAMPFIRYDIGDHVTLSTKKYGSNHLIAELHGRSADFAILPDGRKVPSLTFYYVTKALMKQGSSIDQVIIRQLDLYTYKLEYVASQEVSNGMKGQIEQEMQRYLVPGLTLIFERKNELARLPSGKFRQFYNEMN